MTTKSTNALAALAAILTFAIAVGSASANKLSYSEQHFRIIFASLSFSESGGGLSISCPVTLEGSFHSATLSKTIGADVADVEGAAIDNPNCTEGHATILSETLPWQVTYGGFGGTLPSISEVRHYLIGAGFQVEPGLGIVCLAQTTEEFPAAGDAIRESRGDIISLITDSSLAIPITGENCPAFGIFSNSGEVYVLNSEERRVNLTLI